MRARPTRFSDSTGLRLCGIDEEPFWPAEKYSSASNTSVRCKWRISVASRSTEAATTHGVAVTRNDLGRDRLDPKPHLARDMGFDPRIDLGKSSDRAGDRAGRDLGARRDQALQRAGKLRIGDRKLKPERG